MLHSHRSKALIGLLSGVTVVTALIASRCGYAQSIDSTIPTGAFFQESIQSDFFGDDARAMGMGNTGIVTGNDGSALISNPANLARIRRIEFRFGLSHQRVSNDSRIITDDQVYSGGQFLRKTRINALSLAIPIPTYRGSLVVGFGLNRVNSFDRSAGFLYPPTQSESSSIAREMESGGLWKWTAGAAMDISPRLSVGLSTHLLTGKDDYNWRRSATSDPSSPILEERAIRISYVGVAGTAGASYAVSHLLTAGVVIESPTYMAAEETYPGITDSLSSYSLTRPFAFGAGLSGETGPLTLTADLRYTDWSQLEVNYDSPSVSNQGDQQYISDNLREEISWHLGAEYLLPAQGIELRAGYYLDPLPVANYYIETQRKYLTFGAGFLFDQVMVLDIAYVHGGYELRNTNPGQSFEKYTSNRVFVTFGYRM